MSEAFTPSLQLRETLSHMADPARVIGFEGRDKTYGSDALSLKSDEIPSVRDAPAVTHYVVPEHIATRVEQTDVRLYILADNFVYWVPLKAIEESPVHTGEVHGDSVTGRKVPIEDMLNWPRNAVEVGV